MERIDSVQLQNALTAREGSLRKRLSTADSSTLIALLEGLVRRYPSQDLAASIDELLEDYEALVMAHGIAKVQRAVAALRIDPEQRFFPRPDEVAKEIQAQRLRSMPADIYARQ